MNEEQFQKAMDALYEESREDGPWAMINQFYSREMRSFTILLWAYFLTMFLISVVLAILFFHAEQIRWQIAYAALFVVFMEWIPIIKVIAVQVMNRNSIKREIKRLELRIAELTAARKN